MTYRSYPEYLESAHWAFTRKKILERDSYKCVVCKQDAKQVHHINYRKLINVVDDDLMSVCEGCHCLIHAAIDKGYIRLNNKGSLEKTLQGLSDMKNNVQLSKADIENSSKRKITHSLVKKLNKLHYNKKRLIFGI